MLLAQMQLEEDVSGAASYVALTVLALEGDRSTRRQAQLAAPATRPHAQQAADNARLAAAVPLIGGRACARRGPAERASRRRSAGLLPLATLSGVTVAARLPIGRATTT